MKTVVIAAQMTMIGSMIKKMKISNTDLPSAFAADTDWII